MPIFRALFIFVILLANVTPASAQTATPTAKWDPEKVSAKTLAGTCPMPKIEDAACPLERGVSYDADVSFVLDSNADQLIIRTDGGGLDVTACYQDSKTGNCEDFTPAVKAGVAVPLKLTVGIPEANPHRERAFYLGKVYLSDGSGRVKGSLLISLVVGKSSVSWARPLVAEPPSTATCTETLNNIAPGDRAPLETIIPSGCSLSRLINVDTTIDASEFAIRANTERVTLSGVPDTLQAGQDTPITMNFTAPIVTRRTRQDVVLSPMSGFLALQSTLRMRITILPAEVKWSPPEVRGTLNVTTQKPIDRTVTLTSNVDIPGVRFKTADVGLTPIMSPAGTVDLKAGKPQEVKLRLCPGYAATTYFIGITAYQGNQPLNKRLTIKMTVEGDDLPPSTTPPCTG